MLRDGRPTEKDPIVLKMDVVHNYQGRMCHNEREHRQALRLRHLPAITPSLSNHNFALSIGLPGLLVSISDCSLTAAAVIGKLAIAETRAKVLDSCAGN